MIHISRKYGILATHPFYAAWYNMVKRCTDPAHPNWDRYGGRGIAISPDWLDFGKFKADMFLTWRKGLELERIDNNVGYSKSNCCWTTRIQQCQNTSATKLSAEKVEAMRIMRRAATVKEVATAFNISESHCSRVLRGLKWL